MREESSMSQIALLINLLMQYWSLDMEKLMGKLTG